MTRTDVEWSAEGVTLRGWFYTPADASGPLACVVLQHGFSGVKEMRLDAYATVIAEAGLACLVYDHPGFGASDAVPGTPRGEIDPWQQIRYIQHAITYAQSRPEVDPDGIGLWGSSYGAAHTYVTAAIDRRVKAAVGQVPLISGSQAFASLIRIDQWANIEAMFAADRLSRLGGAEPMMVPVVDPDPTVPAALRTADAYEWVTRMQKEEAPDWRNEITLRSLEMLRGYEPGLYLPLVSPTPLLMVVAPHDRLVAGEWACAAYERAVHPKKLVLIPGGHFDVYDGQPFELSSQAARDWFAEHLLR